jgi:hypothetical protein
MPGIYKKISVLLLVVWFASIAGASSQPGFEFLRIGYSARFSGLGETYTAISGDVNSLFYNPAGLAPIMGRTASATYIDHLLDFNSGFIGLVFPYKTYGNLAIGAMYVNYGDFQESDIVGNVTGTFTASDFVMGASFASHYRENILYGVTGKLIHSSIGSYSSNAFALDLGLIYQIPEINFNFGIALRNIGTVTKAFEKTKESLPVALDLGISKKLKYLPVVLNLAYPGINEDASSLGERITRYAISFEGTFYHEMTKFRVGYNHQKQKDLKAAGTSMGGFSLGIGILWKTYQFDYSYSPFGDLGNVNRFGLSLSF